MGTDMSDADLIVPKLKERFPQAILDVSEFRGETTVTVRAADMLPVCRFLRDDPDLAYDLCLFVSAVDQLDLGAFAAFCGRLSALLAETQPAAAAQGAAVGRAAGGGQRDLGLARRRLARAGDLRPVRHPLPRPPRDAAHPAAPRLGRPSAAQGLSIGRRAGAVHGQSRRSGAGHAGRADPGRADRRIGRAALVQRAQTTR